MFEELFVFDYVEREIDKENRKQKVWEREKKENKKKKKGIITKGKSEGQNWLFITRNFFKERKKKEV